MIGDKIIVDAVNPSDLAQFTDGWMKEFGLVQLTEQDRRKILGLNCLRMHGLDPAEVVQRVAHDELARAQRVPPSWSALRGTARPPSS